MTSEQRPIGLGVVGYGPIARDCLRATVRPDSGLRLVTLCGVDAAMLDRTAQEFAIPHTARQFDDVLMHPDVEAVAVYSPDPLHFPMIRDALRAGKDVVVTKPMVISSDQARQVLDLLRETGRTLLVGETSRYSLHCIVAHKLTEDGDLGRIVFGETSYVHDMRPVFDRTPWRYLEPKDFPVGSMCHPISLLTWYLGEVDEVFAYGVNSGVDPRYPATTPDTYLVNLKFRNGALGRILGAFGIIEPPLPMESLSLFGTAASLVNNRLVLDRVPSKPVATFDFDAENDHDGEVRRYLAEFVRAVRDGEPSSSTALDAANTVAIGEAIKESVVTGLPVRVTSFSEVPA